MLPATGAHSDTVGAMNAAPLPRVVALRALGAVLGSLMRFEDRPWVATWNAVASVGLCVAAFLAVNTAAVAVLG